MQPAPYSALTPDCVLDSLSSIGLKPDGRLLALNSYENRVYQAWTEEGPPFVAKFYRPARWSDAQIMEEHEFARELAGREIPIVAPVALAGGTLHEHGGFRFAVYPRRGGRPPELEDRRTLEWIGRFISRIHAAGATRSFLERPALDIESHGVEPNEVRPMGDVVEHDADDVDESRRGGVVEVGLVRTEGGPYAHGP